MVPAQHQVVINHLMQFSFLFCLIFKKELLLGTKASDCKEEDSSSLLRAGEEWAEHPIKRCAYVPNAESVSAPAWKRTLANAPTVGSSAGTI